MPAKSKAQKRLMQACASPSGRKWARRKGVKCPPADVAKKYAKGRPKKERVSNRRKK